MPGSIRLSLRSLLRHLSRLILVAAVSAVSLARADELADVQRMYYAGQADAAMKRADEFLIANPKDAQMRFIKAVMLADAKRNPEAIALFRKISEDHPDLAEPYNNLAVLYASAGDYTQARATLEQALRTNPNYATAHENLGDVHAALAAQSYARAQKLDPASATLPTKLAIVRELYKRPGLTDPAALAAQPKTGVLK